MNKKPCSLHRTSGPLLPACLRGWEGKGSGQWGVQVRWGWLPKTQNSPWHQPGTDPGRLLAGHSASRYSTHAECQVPCQAIGSTLASATYQHRQVLCFLAHQRVLPTLQGALLIPFISSCQALREVRGTPGTYEGESPAGLQLRCPLNSSLAVRRIARVSKKYRTPS